MGAPGDWAGGSGDLASGWLKSPLPVMLSDINLVANPAHPIDNHFQVDRFHLLSSFAGHTKSSELSGESSVSA